MRDRVTFTHVAHILLALLERAQQAGAPTAGKSTAKTQCYTGPVVNPGPYDRNG